jgi:hypothetical protein
MGLKGDTKNKLNAKYFNELIGRSFIIGPPELQTEHKGYLITRSEMKDPVPDEEKVQGRTGIVQNKVAANILKNATDPRKAKKDLGTYPANSTGQNFMIVQTDEGETQILEFPNAGNTFVDLTVSEFKSMAKEHKLGTGKNDIHVIYYKWDVGLFRDALRDAMKRVDDKAKQPKKTKK